MKLLFLLLLVPFAVFSQDKNADAIVSQARAAFDKIKDYQVDAMIKLDLDMVKMPSKKAKIYFKQPDKIKIDAKGFVMMHKKAINFNINAFLDKGFTALYIRKDMVDGSQTDVIKIIPKDESSDNVLTTVWIDSKKYCIRKIENSSKTTGSFTVEMKYGTNTYNLPDKMVVTFDAGKNQGIQIAAEMQGPTDKKKTKRGSKGTVTIEYTNYLVNKGLSDNLFIKK